MPAVKPSVPRLMRSKSLAQGLVGAWPFYEGGGLTANDVSDNSFDGTLSGSTLPSWVSGQSGWCLSFDGSTSYVTLPVVPVPTGYTWAHWIQGNAAPAATIQKTLIDGTNSSDILGFSWGHSNASFRQAAVHQNAAGSFFAAKITATLSGGVWYHIAGTWDGANLRCYLNGTLQATTAVTTIKTPTTAMVFGRGGVAATFFPGLIDSVLLYSRPLSAAEIAALYADSYQLFRPSRTILKASAAPAGNLFRPGNLSGLGSGGPFFQDPLGV